LESPVKLVGREREPPDVQNRLDQSDTARADQREPHAPRVLFGLDNRKTPGPEIAGKVVFHRRHERKINPPAAIVDQHPVAVDLDNHRAVAEAGLEKPAAALPVLEYNEGAQSMPRFVVRLAQHPFRRFRAYPVDHRIALFVGQGRGLRIRHLVTPPCCRAHPLPGIGIEQGREPARPGKLGYKRPD